MTQRWKYIIGFSVLLNVLLIGVLIGKATSPAFPRFPPPSIFNKDSELRVIMEKSMHENRPIDLQIMETRHKINTLLSAKEIDHAQFEKLTTELTNLHNQKFKNITEALFQTASKLSLEKRQQLVEELEHLPPPPGFK
ncbi:periplasmic heavy metal sensor [Hydrogenovibrio sp. JE_KL2]|uniref:periplasmic heavy metal sensor n=1 Tax=Hydrogenovibrio sp. JE_KL2 TaxID=2651188 RepID=UPI00128CCAC4|nr:periplasmic heavy metal sensor [Hydrogenovibrio sp. JE_KL2]MPQ76798.1 periplasmic heavy metal sensor [Hydrogenovibrio sp. JE_KL2]